MDSAIDLILEQLHTWYINFWSTLPNFIAAILFLVVYVLVFRWIKRALVRLLEKTIDYNPVYKLIVNLSYVIIITIGLLIALGILKLDGTVNKLLAGAGIIGLGISFAFQDIMANIFSGAYITMKQVFRVGDYIESNGIFGSVKGIKLRSIAINNLDGQEVLIPSRMILQQPLTNYSTTGTRRVVVNVGVQYSEDLDKVKKVVLETISSLEGRLKDKPVELFFTEFADSSINLMCRYWIKYDREPDYKHSLSDAIMAIKAAFEANDITIPFPIRTIEMGSNNNNPNSGSIIQIQSDNPSKS
ncbi:MAG: mechanosensitive ion channel family protein [Desulfobulbaceae bacterium]|nr:mechanosensitive ion channel family protein [Candidatus Kapabacteria bacterium]MBS3999529.1 mechanosensitive ion channel family protein [Desulfobulbaceae bacterium]